MTLNPTIAECMRFNNAFLKLILYVKPNEKDFLNKSFDEQLGTLLKFFKSNNIHILIGHNFVLIYRMVTDKEIITIDEYDTEDTYSKAIISAFKYLEQPF